MGRYVGFAMLILLTLLLGACVGQPGATLPATDTGSDAGAETDTGATPSDLTALDATLPALSTLELEADELIRVIATTNLVADVVAQVGGARVEVTALIPTGADPHSYSPTPQNLRALNDAHVIFINGLGLEETLLPVLTNLDRPVPIVSVNAGVSTVEFGAEHDAEHSENDDEEHEHAPDHDDAHEESHEDEHAEDHDPAHDHSGADPHTWQSVPNVQQWVENIHTVLSALDPDHARVYGEHANTYMAKLEALDADIRAQVATIPTDARKLVTDHSTFDYYAREYGLEVVGAVIGSFSTMAAPSAQELAALQDQIRAEEARAIFVGTTVNPSLAQQLSQDLGIEVVTLHTGSLSEADGPAATYVDFMRFNTAAIVNALTE